jgi:hypothetical protein
MMLLRTAVTNPDDSERLRSIFASQLVLAIHHLTGDSPDARLCAGLVATLVLGMDLCRHFLALPPVVDMSREQIADLGGADTAALSGGVRAVIRSWGWC